uniref:(northern house mosquito) hypothetical protein n=1 Tax=Culex pipiens TaxID=7175 RepID=A0A8D8DFH5_CULPI
MESADGTQPYCQEATSSTNQVHIVSPTTSKKQKRLGPAPIASIEEPTSDENKLMDSQNQTQRSRWYNTKECVSPKMQSSCTSALTPSTPRIDISRASSHSSHHDSRDSSPENVFEQVKQFV